MSRILSTGRPVRRLLVTFLATLAALVLVAGTAAAGPAAGSAPAGFAPAAHGSSSANSTDCAGTGAGGERLRAAVGKTRVLNVPRPLLLGSGGRVRIRWRLLSRPPYSHARLRTAVGRHASLRPDVPGRYQVKVTVGRGSRARSAVLTVSATYSEPLVPFDSIAYTDSSPPVPALRIGGNLYPSDNQPLQVYVLCRGTLELFRVQGYQANSQAYAALQSYLKGLNDTYLVIVSHAGSQALLPADSLDQLDQALGAIGGTVGAQWVFGAGSSSAAACWAGETDYCNAYSSEAVWTREKLYGGSFTTIGVPTLPAGDAWRETAVQNGTQDGRITGYLTPGVDTATAKGTDYTVVPGPDPYLPVDTCTSDGCAVKVGDKTYPADPAVPNGFHVVVLDRTTLAKITNTTVTSTGALDSAITGIGLNFPAVGHAVNYQYGLNDQRLVILQSVGNGKLSSSGGPHLLEDIDQLGGTPDYLADAIFNGCRYALVGVAANLPWQGTAMESSIAMKPGYYSNGTPDCSQVARDPSGQIDGVLQRDRDGLYTPTTGDPAGQANWDLYRILYQPTTPWPMADETMNLRYVADNIGLCQPDNQACTNADVRSAYPNPALKEAWGGYQGRLDTLTCPPKAPYSGQCDSKTFKDLKTELEQEFTWVTLVYGLGESLLAPYQSTTTPFQVQDVVKDITTSVQAAGRDIPSGSNATMQWLGIFTTVAGIAAKAAAPISPEAAAVFGVLAGAGTLATQLMQAADGGPADSVTAAVTTAADGLSNQMAKQQQAYYEWVLRMETILLSDYGKLAAIGATPGNAAWDFTGRIVPAIDALNAAARAQAYSALLPLAWPGYNLKPGNQPSSDDVTKYICDEPSNFPYNHNYLFAPMATPLRDQDQFHAVSSLGNGTSGPAKQVWLLAYTQPWTSPKIDAWANLPSDKVSLTDKIYGDASTGAAGAGAYEASWWWSTFNPPSHVTCLEGNNSLDVRDVWSKNYPPPKITPPLP